MPTHIYSFGFRHGLPQCNILPSVHNSKQYWVVEKDGVKNLVIDVRRILPKNPYHDKRLRALRGDNAAVIEELEKTPGLEKGYWDIRDLVELHDGPVYIGCTGGHHRSVYIANRLEADLEVPVTHLNYNDK